MENAGLFHDHDRGLIICLDHGNALLPPTIVDHLRKKHKVKGAVLRAAEKYIQDIKATLVSPTEFVQPADYSDAIPCLKVETGFACSVAGCSKEKDWLSQNKRNVEKHISRCRQHTAQQPIESTLLNPNPVTFQSVFSRPNYSPFIISEIRQQFPARAIVEVSHNASDIFNTSYMESLQAERDQLGTVSLDTHVSQIPPWVSRTGIVRFLDTANKQHILSLLAVPEREDSIPFLVLHNAVSECIIKISKRVTPGERESRFDRVACRHLASFEPGRTSIRPFSRVQMEATARRYARSWSLLITVLIRMQSPDWHELFNTQYLRVSPNVEAELASVQMYANQLNVEGEEGEAHTHSNEMLQQAIQRLSYLLVRVEHEGTGFKSVVVQFCALNTINKEGMWILAADFAPFLSGMIHCMQLWLASYCLETVPVSTSNSELNSLVEGECKRFLVNTTRTPMAELLFWRLVCWKASNDTIMHPVTTIDEARTTVMHLQVTLLFDNFRQGLHALFEEAKRVLEHDLMFNLRGAPRFQVAHLVDNPSNLASNFSFLDDPRNNFQLAKGWLVNQVKRDEVLRARFLSDNSAVDDDLSQINSKSLRAYVTLHQRFLSLLVVIFYLTAGLPPRREELVGLVWRNRNTARNVYISNGLIAIVTGYHKSQWRVGNRPVARFLPPAVGNLLVHYLVYVTPFIQWVRYSLKEPSLGGYLFTHGGPTPWSPHQVSNCMERQTLRRFGFSITTRQWRHMAIAIDRRMLDSSACRVYQIKEHFGRQQVREPEMDDSDLDGNPFDEGREDGQHAVSFEQNIAHLQAAHTARTGNMVYGNANSILFGLTDSLLANFRVVSRRWHDFIAVTQEDMPPPPPPTVLSMPKRRVPHEESPRRPAQAPRLTLPPATHSMQADPLISQLPIRAALWTQPAIERALKQLLGSEATFKSKIQRDALRVIASSDPESLIIMPTGAGKSLLYVLPTLLPGAHVTIVITPLVALQQDLIRRCTEWEINFGVFQPRSALLPIAAQPSLLFVDAERASGDSFQHILSDLSAAGRLDRIVLDEAHLLLTASHYRESLPKLAIMQRFHCPFVCLTATLPPRAEREFRSLLCLTPNLELLRASADRPNLCYSIRKILRPEEQLINASIRMCRGLLEQYDDDPTARIICYVRNKRLGAVLAEELDSYLYHATLDKREDNLNAWRLGTKSTLIVATTALGAGVDYRSVRCVLHVDAPAGMVDYAQETGRAGRDGELAECIVLLPARWEVSWERGFQTDFLTEDCAQMSQYLRSSAPQCLRQQLTSYLDGGPGVSCPPSGSTRCGHCLQSLSVRGSPALSDVYMGQDEGLQLPEVLQEPGMSPGHEVEMGVSQGHEEETVVRVEEEHNGFGNEAGEGDGFLSQPEDLGSSSEEGEESEEESSPSNEQDDDSELVYSVAEANQRLRAMQSSDGLQVYQDRVTAWKPACIPCSLRHRRFISGSHADCTRDDNAIRRFRLDIKFANYIGCWSCGQPLLVCNRRSCDRSLLIFDVCHSALLSDNAHAVAILHALGCPLPALPAGSSTLQPPTEAVVLCWIGLKSRLYAIEASNAALFTHHWLDRLQSLCHDSLSRSSIGYS